MQAGSALLRVSISPPPQKHTHTHTHTHTHLVTSTRIPKPHPALATHGEAQGLKQQLVCEHVHGQLLVTEAVDARGARARRGADLLL
jgi:hypothetical protein